jgi:hypothetical protein
MSPNPSLVTTKDDWLFLAKTTPCEFALVAQFVMMAIATASKSRHMLRLIFILSPPDEVKQF